MYESNRGVTLIELVVIMAVIAIISVAAIAGLANARESSRIKSAEQVMEANRVAVMACLGRGIAMNDRVEGEYVCGTDGVRWSTLSPGWTYTDATAVTVDIMDRSFEIKASGDSKVVTCNQTACTTT